MKGKELLAHFKKYTNRAPALEIDRRGGKEKSSLCVFLYCYFSVLIFYLRDTRVSEDSSMEDMLRSVFCVEEVKDADVLLVQKEL